MVTYLHKTMIADTLAGVAAESAEQRVTAPMTLAALQTLLTEALIRCEHDPDPRAFAKIAHYYRIPGQSCVLTHVTNTLEAIDKVAPVRAPRIVSACTTWNPKSGLTNARRNCISKVRNSGLSYQQAVMKLRSLM